MESTPVPLLRSLIAAAWIAFWLYWLISARGAKRGTRARRARVPVGAAIVVSVLFARSLGASALAVRSTPLRTLGSVVLLSGLALAVWARVHLGRNWGMPMTRKQEPELVTSGPYRHVRHPIYSGILLAVLGTALATDIVLMVVLVVIGAYFGYCARVEEDWLCASFPGSYPAYRASTKMLIPFVL
ncbi:MAG: isoprenylcysteine carboxylmethyltransferase family protein [Acidobacteriota bacterium]|nr:isoprenylcysteine carboxylmethyltransferase family protein [Acidobacteriota bacterium]